MATVIRDKRFPSATGICDIRYRVWIPDEPRACMQIMHGMAEHIDRYQDFAAFLADNGILVCAMDDPGHGKSVAEGQPLGYFGEQNGWDNLIKDNQTLHALIKADYPALPFILFGHSMGSFLARTYAGRLGHEFDGFIFSGTAGANPALGVAKMLAKSSIIKGHGKEPNAKLDALSFGSYNKKIKPSRTPFDWLSRDEENVDKYIADPLCGFVFTSYGFLDLFTGLSEISDMNWARRVPKRPILLIAGDHDPVGGMGKGVRQVEGWLKKSGHKPVLKLYAGARHEVLNETNRTEVYQDVLLFIETVCATGEFE